MEDLNNASGESTPDRLRALVDAYGADPLRWPAAERAATRAHGAQESAAWHEARNLDRMLAAHVVAPPHSALYARIAATAPAPGASWWRTRFWWPSVGFAGVGLAGIAAGVLAASLLVAVPHSMTPDWSYTSTAFGGASQNWSDE